MNTFDLYLKLRPYLTLVKRQGYIGPLDRWTKPWGDKNPIDPIYKGNCYGYEVSWTAIAFNHKSNDKPTYDQFLAYNNLTDTSDPKMQGIVEIKNGFQSSVGPKG